MISLFKTNPIPTKMELLLSLDGQELNGCSFKVKKSEFDEDELEVAIWYEEDVEIQIKKLFSLDAPEIVEYLKKKGQEKVIKRIYSFINLERGVLEIYRGGDYVTEKIKKLMEGLLEIQLKRVYIKSRKLLELVEENSLELKQATFKYVDDLYYYQLRGNNLEGNKKYMEYIKMNPMSLRAVSISPDIKYINGGKYSVNIDGDRGTVKIMNGAMKWRPRLEVRQIVNMVTT